MQGGITGLFLRSWVRGPRGSRVQGSGFVLRCEVRNTLDQIEVEAKNAFGEVIAALLDAADPQIDLRASSIETLQTLQNFRAKLFEAKHRRGSQQGQCPQRRAWFCVELLPDVPMWWPELRTWRTALSQQLPTSNLQPPTSNLQLPTSNLQPPTSAVRTSA